MAGRRRSVHWTLPGRPWLEHLRLVEDDGGVTADGVVLGTLDGDPFRIRYRVRCDGGWRCREVSVASLDEGAPSLALLSAPTMGVTTKPGHVNFELPAWWNSLPPVRHRETQVSKVSLSAYRSLCRVPLKTVLRGQ